MKHDMISGAKSPFLRNGGEKVEAVIFFFYAEQNVDVGVDYIRGSAGHFFLIDKAISGGVMNSVCGSFYLT